MGWSGDVLHLLDLTEIMNTCFLLTTRKTQRKVFCHQFGTLTWCQKGHFAGSKKLFFKCQYIIILSPVMDRKPVESGQDLYKETLTFLYTHYSCVRFEMTPLWWSLGVLMKSLNSESCSWYSHRKYKKAQRVRTFVKCKLI